MGERRLRLETGAREEDVRDDSPKGGLFHRNEKTHDRHHLKPTWFVSRQDGSMQDGSKARDLNAHYHREHTKEHDGHHDHEAWMVDRCEALESRVADLEAQNEFWAMVLGHGLGPELVERLTKQWQATRQ